MLVNQKFSTMVNQVQRRLRTERQDLGLSQAELVRRAEVSSVAKLCSYELGYGTLTPEELVRVSYVLEQEKLAQERKTVSLATLAGYPAPAKRRLLRVRAGLTQIQLAHRMGVSQGKISPFENGKFEFSQELWAKWYRVIQEATQAVSLSSDDQLERSHEKIKLLEEAVANLKQQLRNRESMLVNEQEMKTLLHGQVEVLKEQLKRVTTPEEFAQIQQMEGVAY